MPSISPIRIGVVGLSKDGWASSALIPPILQFPLSSSYTLNALSTTSEASATEAAKKYTQSAGHTVKAYYGDTTQIASDKDVDLVVVAVKATAHMTAALPAIEAGKDVFIEWPVGKDLKETTAIAEAALRKNVRNMVGLQGRLCPTVQKLKEIIASGKIGKIQSTSIIAMAPREIFFWGPWVNDRNAYTADANGGGTLLDIAVGHMLDSVTYVLGNFTSVSATLAIQYPTATLFDTSQKPTGKTVPVSAPDHVAFTGLLSSGAVTSVTWRGGLASTTGRKQFVWEIDGEEGSVRVENDGIAGAFMQAIEPMLYLNGERVEVTPNDLPNNSATAWREYASGSKGQYATLEDAVRCRRVLDAIRRSAEEGRRVELK